jgi:hypothetical protein
MSDLHGSVTASLMLRKLGAYPRQNGLAVALRELGKIERTMFLLQYISSVELRRRIHVGLNKGEAKNALARAVFFNRLGELRDRTHENQRHRASGSTSTWRATTTGARTPGSETVNRVRSGPANQDLFLSVQYLINGGVTPTRSWVTERTISSEWPTILEFRDAKRVPPPTASFAVGRPSKVLSTK